MHGTIKKLCGNKIAVIEINDKYLNAKELFCCVDNWEICEFNK